MAVHVQKVFGGEYDVPCQSPSVVLDIGANVGAFALWACRRWPQCVVHCYEPLPDNFDLLQQNLGALSDRIHLNQFAIGNPDRTKLHLGMNNCGEASFFDLGEQREEFVEVMTRHPEVLPKADVLKIDAEGSEVEILQRLPGIQFDAVMLEYHSECNRRAVDDFLADYALVGGHVRGLDRGVLKYLHRRLI